jgi:hypothetical protein
MNHRLDDVASEPAAAHLHHPLSAALLPRTTAHDRSYGGAGPEKRGNKGRKGRRKCELPGSKPVRKGERPNHLGKESPGSYHARKGSLIPSLNPDHEPLQLRLKGLHLGIHTFSPHQPPLSKQVLASEKSTTSDGSHHPKQTMWKSTKSKEHALWICGFDQTQARSAAFEIKLPDRTSDQRLV